MLTISWDGLAALCRDLAARIAREYSPDVVVGIARVGTLPGALIALLLRRDFQSLRVPVPDLPEALPPHLPVQELVKGRRVLLVDEVARDGSTLRWAVDALRRLGAKEVRTLVLFASRGGAKTDYSGPEASVTVLQPWVRDTAIVDDTIRHGQSRQEWQGNPS